MKSYDFIISNATFSLGIDTTKEELDLYNKILSEDSAQKLSQMILTQNPFFNTYWKTDEAFVFEDIYYDELADSININLLENDQSFKLTWYGKINSTYKKRWGRYHQGLDLDLKTGDFVYAAFDGIVRYAQFNSSGFGNCVIIRHLNGLETVYGHLSKINVAPNQFVKSGHIIGLGGSTGRSTGPHLHFETRYRDFSFDPLLIIDPETQTLHTSNFTLKKEFLYPYKYGKSTKLSGSKDIENAQSQSSVKVLFKESNSTTTENLKNKEMVSIVSVDGDTANKVQSSSMEPENFVLKNVPEGKNKSVVVNKENSKGTSSKSTTAKKGTAPKKPSKNAKVYTVKKGDNLYDISRKTGVPIDKIKRLNKLKTTNKIMPGDKLKL